jgi:hypothetical protein
MLTLITLKGLLHERVHESWHDDRVPVLWMLSWRQKVNGGSYSDTQWGGLTQLDKDRVNKYHEGAAQKKKTKHKRHNQKRKPSQHVRPMPMVAMRLFVK